MCAELPRISRAPYAVQQNCVYFPQVIIEKHSSVDVASILGVHHVNPQCYVIVLICVSVIYLHELCLQLNVCMCYSVSSIRGG